MAISALDIMSLEEAKYELDIPVSSTDRDARVLRMLEVAVGYVDKESGYLLLDNHVRYDLCQIDRSRASIIIPSFHPLPSAIAGFAYQRGGILQSAIDNDRTPRSDIFNYIDYYTNLGRYVIKSRGFNPSMTEWPDNMEYPYINATKGYGSFIPPRYKVGIAVTLRALYDNEPIPEDQVRSMINA